MSKTTFSKAFSSYFNDNASARYVTPFAVFMAFTAAQDHFSGSALFFLYGLKIFFTAFAVYVCFKGRWEEIEGRFDFRAVVLGLVVLAIWILLPKFLGIVPKTEIFAPTGFDSTLGLISGLVVRIIGAAIIVPIIEEIFWRSFLMRYLIDANFLKIKLGTYTHFSFWAVVALFPLAHRAWEWPGAILTATLYGGYCVWSKNLKGCILAHAVTNLGLAIYVIATEDWAFW